LLEYLIGKENILEQIEVVSKREMYDAETGSRTEPEIRREHVNRTE
jgi:hypothetical protein